MNKNDCYGCGINPISYMLGRHYCEKCYSNNMREERIKELLKKHKIEYEFQYVISNKKIDFMIKDSIIEFYIIIEVDQYQHNQPGYENEENRMKLISKMLDKPVIFIRFNPDVYIHSDINYQIIKSYENREETLINLIRELSISEIKESGIIYLYYDNRKMSNDIKEMIIPIELYENFKRVPYNYYKKLDICENKELNKIEFENMEITSRIKKESLKTIEINKIAEKLYEKIIREVEFNKKNYEENGEKELCKLCYREYLKLNREKHGKTETHKRKLKEYLIENNVIIYTEEEEKRDEADRKHKELMKMLDELDNL